MGSIITVIVITCILAYGSYKARIMFNKANNKVSSALQITDFNYTNPVIMQMNELGFDFSIQTLSAMTPNMGKIEVVHQELVRIKNKTTGLVDF